MVKKFKPKNTQKWDVYEDEKQPLGQIKRKGRSNYDQVEKVDYSVNKIRQEDDEEIDEDEAFDQEDEIKFGAFFEPSAKQTDNDSDILDETDLDDESEQDHVLDEEMIEYHKHLTNLMPESDKVDEMYEQEIDFSDESDSDQDRIQSVLESLEKPSKKRSIDQVEHKSDKVGLNDLLGVLNEQTGFADLKKQVDQLGKSGKKARKLENPLHPIEIEKLERKAAYEQSKKAITKWQPIVKKNRESDCVDFTQMESKPTQLTNSTMAASFKAETEMEKKIEQILQQNGLEDHKIKEKEELALNKLSKEEIEEKRAELAKMRSLLFYKELKQKKIAKIKSKTYRKLKRKEEIEQLEELDPEAAHEEMLKMETLRAQERMSLRHKNKGKWARAMLNKGEVDSETRKALSEQLQMHQDLKRKIQGIDSDDSLSESEFIDELNEIENDNQEMPTKGVFAMKFMQKQVEKQKTEIKEMAQSLKRSIETGEFSEDSIDSSDASSDSSSEEETEYKQIKQRGVRMAEPLTISVGKTASMPALFPVESFEPTEVSITTNFNEIAKVVETQVDTSSDEQVITTADAVVQVVDEESENPWLAGLKETVAVKSSTKQSKQPLQKQEKALEKLKKAKHTSPERVPMLLQVDTVENSQESSSEDEESARKVMKMAFANDDVELEFEETKDQIVDQDQAQDKDVTLPGWGSWAGPGIKTSTKKMIIKANPNDGVAPEKRQDAKLKHVIINEKRMKKASKYMLPNIPHGFQTREQYERTIRQPLGKEWNSINSYQKKIKPKTITRQGEIVLPMKSSSFKNSKKQN